MTEFVHKDVFDRPINLGDILAVSGSDGVELKIVEVINLTEKRVKVRLLDNDENTLSWLLEPSEWFVSSNQCVKRDV